VVALLFVFYSNVAAFAAAAAVLFALANVHDRMHLPEALVKMGETFGTP
jgi:amino acid transporter